MAVNIKVLGVTLVKVSWGLMIPVSSEFCDQLLPSFRRKHIVIQLSFVTQRRLLVIVIVAVAEIKISSNMGFTIDGFDDWKNSFLLIHSLSTLYTDALNCNWTSHKF